MYVPVNSKLLEDQQNFMSLDAALGVRTRRYGIYLSLVIHLVTIVIRRMTMKAMRGAEYIVGCGD